MEEIQADVDMTGIVPSWRPETGMVLYGVEEQDYYGWLVADDSNKVTFVGSNEFVDELTGKPLSRNTAYTYQDGKTIYRITYQIEDIIFRDIF